MWGSKVLAYISSLGCLHVVKATANPVMVGDINVFSQELKRRHTSQGVKDARYVYGLLMESMAGYSIAEFRMQKATSPRGAWEELHKYYMPNPSCHANTQEGVQTNPHGRERGPPVVPC